MSNITVTQAFLPPRKDFDHYLDTIWRNHHLTNNGPLHREFEQRMRSLLGSNNFHFVTNGTLALQLALNALDITEGEVITTPFSYVATTSAILWQRCKPVFVDISSTDLCIDPHKVEAAITPRTKAILAVHVFGLPCDIDAIATVARKHNLKVIYDAAHAFGASYRGKSLVTFGDISICSFHATKVFHTIEGGCLIAADEAVSARIELEKRFGHNGDNHLLLGINAKASEFQAAMGLTNLPYLSACIEARRKIWERYRDELGNDFTVAALPRNFEYNFSYFPLQFKNESALKRSLAALTKHGINARRYFYPALNTLPYVGSTQACPVAERIARRIICLPLFPGLADKDISRIIRILKEAK
jgi:dTDP-4-amino-4,6-dideoxygalactose transaminase